MVKCVFSDTLWSNCFESVGAKLKFSFLRLILLSQKSIRNSLTMKDKSCV